MRIAARTGYFGARHAMRAIDMGAYAVGGQRQPEARPARARVVLGIRAEQLLPAAHAGVDALVLVVRVLAREGGLRALLLRHRVLQRRQARAQFRITGRLRRHRRNSFGVGLHSLAQPGALGCVAAGWADGATRRTSSALSRRLKSAGLATWPPSTRLASSNSSSASSSNPGPCRDSRWRTRGWPTLSSSTGAASGTLCPLAASRRRICADSSPSPRTRQAGDSRSRSLTRTSMTRSASASLTRLSSALLSLRSLSTRAFSASPARH